jgi:hypothetical protein
MKQREGIRNDRLKPAGKYAHKKRKLGNRGKEFLASGHDLLLFVSLLPFFPGHFTLYYCSVQVRFHPAGTPGLSDAFE